MIKPIFIVSLLSLLLILTVSQPQVYNRVFLTAADQPEAVCLDGSPGAHYLFKGDPNKVLIYFYGGGWCGASTVASTLESCYQRSKTSLGSSNFTTSTISVSSGIGSNNTDNYFRDWTKVLLTYCDGSGHQGYKKDPVQYKGIKLYFKGQRVVKGHFNSLQKSIGLLTKVQNIALSGASAGGLATYLWTNWLRDNSKAKNVWSIPDSGIFLNEKNVKGQYMYENQFINLMKLSNAENVAPPCKQCVAKNPNQLHKCMFAENIYQDIKVPLFNIQSQYDSWSIPNILGVTCISGNNLDKCSEKDRQIIQSYHAKTNGLLQKIKSKFNNSGAWAPVCVDHVYSFGGAFYSQYFRVPQNTEFSSSQVIKRWIQNGKDSMNYQHIDTGNWPSNKPCSGSSFDNQEQNQQNKEKVKYLVKSILKILKREKKAEK